jgi:hypothetical protein
MSVPMAVHGCFSSLAGLIVGSGSDLLRRKLNYRVHRLFDCAG